MSAANGFAWRATGDGGVLVYWHGRLVKVLKGAAGTRFLARIEGLDSGDAQLEMARVTGNFKRGNERR